MERNHAVIFDMYRAKRTGNLHVNFIAKWGINNGFEFTNLEHEKRSETILLPPIYTHRKNLSEITLRISQVVNSRTIQYKRIIFKNSVVVCII